jgi:hypothetical protein
MEVIMRYRFTPLLRFAFGLLWVMSIHAPAAAQLLRHFEIAPEEQQAGFLWLRHKAPADAPRVDIRLVLTDAEASYSHGTKTMTTFKPHEKLLKFLDNKKFESYYIKETTYGGGVAVYVAKRRRPDIKFLSQNSHEVSMPLEFAIIVEKKSENSEMILFNEGCIYQNSSNLSVDIPITGAPLGANKQTNNILNLNLHFHSEPSASDFVIRQQLVGETWREGERIGVALSPLSLPKPDSWQNIKLSFGAEKFSIKNDNPFKLGEIGYLGNKRVVVEKIALDYSSLTLAFLDGFPVRPQENKAEEKALAWEKILAGVLKTGAETPAFANVELFDRDLFSREELLKAAKPSDWAILIFCDLKNSGALPRSISPPNSNQNPFTSTTCGGSPFGGACANPFDNSSRAEESAPRNAILSLSEQAVMATLSAGLPQPPVMVFVVDAARLSWLYSDYLNSRPGFFVILNQIDPMKTQFIGSWEKGQFANDPSSSNPFQAVVVNPVSFPVGKDSLRRRFGLPEDGVAAVLIDAEGIIRYINPDAGPRLSEVLLEMNALMRKGVASEE